MNFVICRAVLQLLLTGEQRILSWECLKKLIKMYIALLKMSRSQAGQINPVPI